MCRKWLLRQVGQLGQLGQLGQVGQVGQVGRASNSAHCIYCIVYIVDFAQQVQKKQPPAPASGNERAKKPLEKFFAAYTWAKDGTAPLGKDQRKELAKQADKLKKAIWQLKPSDSRHSEAQRFLGILREKAKRAAERRA